MESGAHSSKSPHSVNAQDAPQKGGLRARILAFAGALIVLSVLGSTVSLYRITEVNDLLESINRMAVPMGRLFNQMQSDAEVLSRELDRSLGHSHWSDPHWKPRPIPRWIEDVLESEVARVEEFLRDDANWRSQPRFFGGASEGTGVGPIGDRARWTDWSARLMKSLRALRDDADKLYGALEQKDDRAASELYPKWQAALDDWRHQVDWGAKEYERALRSSFELAQRRSAELRTGLELILFVVISLSLLLWWLGERALRPLAELTRLAREITRRGLRKEDKSLLPEIPISRSDEVSALAREFHRMATALLEREKTVETQKSRLVENNRQLQQIGELNENILRSIDSVILVTDLSGMITQCNPTAARFLGQESGDAAPVLGTLLTAWPQIRGFFPDPDQAPSAREMLKIEPRAVEGRVFGGHWLPLLLKEKGDSPEKSDKPDKQDRPDKAESQGAILTLQDLTEDVELQERLRLAENLAAVGRMSAQVAHEVRNPLHSIGLEAELALESARELAGANGVRQSLQSILSGVDRLQKITESYLRLSRLSSGERREVDLSETLQSVLATYASACESQGVRVDWTHGRLGGSPERLTIHGDRDLLEQALGNLMNNALQAEPEHITWSLGSAESGRVWVRIEDDGPGVPAEVRERLFAPFVTTRAEGTGLGLSFVKQVVEDHGGTIELKRGSCFEIMLPPAVRVPAFPEGVTHA